MLLVPYFKWRGVTLTGLISSGKRFARSASNLKKSLEQEQVAIIECAETPEPFLLAPVTTKQKIALFDQCLTLLKAGILVPQVLTIIAETITAPRLQSIIIDILSQIENGLAFSQALATYPACFDAVTCQLIKAGEESGHLDAAVESVVTHLQLEYTFKQKIRTALFVPAITFAFFIGVAALILFIVLPQFAQFFTSLHKELPRTTYYLLAITALVKTRYFWLALLTVIIVIGLFAKMALRIAAIQQCKDRIALSAPFFGSCVHYKFLAHFFNAMSLLTAGGSKIVPALDTLQPTISNHMLQATIHEVSELVRTGKSLSAALASQRWLFDKETTAMIHVGEESGTISATFAQISLLFQKKLIARLDIIQTLIQPLVLIILGLCAALLIITVYGPLFSLTDIV
jgi:type IV pilus assembly protein PilC